MGNYTVLQKMMTIEKNETFFVFQNKYGTSTLLYLYHRCGICGICGTSHRSTYEKLSVPGSSYKITVE